MTQHESIHPGAVFVETELMAPPRSEREVIQRENSRRFETDANLREDVRRYCLHGPNFTPTQGSTT